MKVCPKCGGPLDANGFCEVDKIYVEDRSNDGLTNQQIAIKKAAGLGKEMILTWFFPEIIASIIFGIIILFSGGFSIYIVTHPIFKYCFIAFGSVLTLIGITRLINGRKGLLFLFFGIIFLGAVISALFFSGYKEYDGYLNDTYTIRSEEFKSIHYYTQYDEKPAVTYTRDDKEFGVLGHVDALYISYDMIPVNYRTTYINKLIEEGYTQDDEFYKNNFPDDYSEYDWYTYLYKDNKVIIVKKRDIIYLVRLNYVEPKKTS